MYVHVYALDETIINFTYRSYLVSPMATPLAYVCLTLWLVNFGRLNYKPNVRTKLSSSSELRIIPLCHSSLITIPNNYVVNIHRDFSASVEHLLIFLCPYDYN